MIRLTAALFPLDGRPPPIGDLPSRKRSGHRGRHGSGVVDTAARILVDLRRCSIDAAVEELITAGARYRMPVSTIASALVRLAGGETSRQRPDTAAQLAAELEWGENYWPPPAWQPSAVEPRPVTGGGTGLPPRDAMRPARRRRSQFDLTGWPTTVRTADRRDPNGHPG